MFSMEFFEISSWLSIASSVRRNSASSSLPNSPPAPSCASLSNLNNFSSNISAILGIFFSLSISNLKQ